MGIVIGPGIENYIQCNIWEYLANYNIYISKPAQIIIMFTVGIFIGSFINVLSMRILDKRDWVKGRSECDECKHILLPLDLIPLVSYTLFKGRCRYCRHTIDKRHPISELIAGVLFILASGNLILTLIYWVLLLNCLTDNYNRVTITKSIYIATAVIVIYNIIYTDSWILNRGILVSIFIIILVVLNNASTETHIGLGDLDIMLLVLAYGGAYTTMLTLAVAGFIGTLILLPKLITHKLDRKSQIPFVPYLTIGFILSERYGGLLWDILTKY